MGKPNLPAITALLELTTEALRRKLAERQSPEFQKAVVRELCIKQQGEFEDELVDALKPVFRRQVEDAAKGLAGLVRGTKHLPGEHDQQSHGRGGKHPSELPTVGEFKLRGGYDSETSLQENYERASKKLFGKKLSNEEFAAVVGAIDGAEVRVGVRSDSRLTVVWEKEGVFAERTIKRIEGETIINNMGFSSDVKGQGIGTESLARQVRFASKNGVAKIQTTALGGKQNGAYTWARLGYDGKLPDTSVKKLKADNQAPDWLKSSQTVHQLMTKPGGREWWINNSETFEGTFDLKPNSLSRKILDGYVEAKFGSRKSTGAGRRGREDSRRVVGQGDRKVGGLKHLPGEHDQQSHGRGLSSAAEAAIENWWSGEGSAGYEGINGAARAGRSHAAFDGLDEAIEKAVPFAEETTLMRGVSVPPGSEVAQNMQKGYSFSDRGYVAMTDQPDVAERFATWGDPDNNAYILKIKVPAGVKAAEIPSGIGEKLFSKDKGYFRVNGVKKRRGKNVWDVDASYVRPDVKAKLPALAGSRLIWTGSDISTKSAKHLQGQHDQQSHGRGGYETGKPASIQSAWHAGSSEFSEGQFGDFDAVFFAQDYEEAAIHGEPREYQLSFDNPLVVESGSLIGQVEEENRLIQQGFDEGRDGIILLDTANDTEFYLVLDLDTIAAKSTKAARPDTQLARQFFNPRAYDEALIDAALPVLARKMGEAAVAQVLLMGGEDPRKFKSKNTKASTATEWLAREGLDPPPGVATNFPPWLVDEIDLQLREVFEQDFWKKINDSTLADINGFIDKGIKQGMSFSDIAAQIKTEAGLGFEYYKRRSLTIARTEGGNLLNAGRRAGIDGMARDLAGVARVRTFWFSILANTTRDSHADMDGKEADADGLFELGGVRVPWPGHWRLPPGERCNCFCSLRTELDAPDELIPERSWQWRKHLQGQHDQQSHGRGGLSSAESEAVEDWSLHLFESARNPRGDGEKKSLRDFQGALDKIPEYEGEVYRSVVVDMSEFGDADYVESVMLSLDEGQSWFADKPCSTSKNKSVTEDFGADVAQDGDIVVNYKIRTKSGADIEDHVAAEVKFQKEVILRPGTEYEVVSVRQSTWKNKFGDSGDLFDLEVREVGLDSDVQREYFDRIGM